MKNDKLIRSPQQDSKFTTFHELMTLRVSEILLISSPYDAYILQEDGPLSERIIHEYRGLNLSRPPRLTWISEGKKALEQIQDKKYDLVIIMPHISDMDSFTLSTAIKQINPDLAVYYFAYESEHLDRGCRYSDPSTFTRTLLWSGNTDLLLAVVKNEEDKMNVGIDTQKAGVRVIIFIEDSPFYLSSLLPVLYREIVWQTQTIMDDSLNEKARILRMRTRPKIMVAQNYEDACKLYQKYKDYLLCVISDVRFPKNGTENALAGIELLTEIRKEKADTPLLVLSSEPENETHAAQSNALFFNKGSSRLHHDIKLFFKQCLGFGTFIFRLENGEIVGQAKNLRSMVNALISIPQESFVYHASRNDFSRWLMARFEMTIAEKIRDKALSDFTDTEDARQFVIDCIKNSLQSRQRGLVIDFVHDEYSPDLDFVKIGTGSLGGKARGLAFISHLFNKAEYDNFLKYDEIDISFPKTVVITTEGFDMFADANGIYDCINSPLSDQELQEIFHNAIFPESLSKDLSVFLQQVTSPLAVRSSAILEDAHFRASAGAYKTYMLPNNEEDQQLRLGKLIEAIKLIYASIFQEAPRTLAKNSFYRQEDDKMAVIIQPIVGQQQDNLFYPAISGVAQSYNYYPIGNMVPEEGIAHIAMGLGKIVVDGGVALRFSPKYPQFLPQFSAMKDILKNAQRFFYALEMEDKSKPLDDLLQYIPVDNVVTHPVLTRIASTYDAENDRLRDYFNGQGIPIISFASILKYNTIPLCDLLNTLLAVGEKGMGCPVEIEFAINFPSQGKPHFYLLQIRPMTVSRNLMKVHISDEEKKRSWCFSEMAMGQSQEKNITDIVFVKNDTFDISKTTEIAEEIRICNQRFQERDESYLLIGPGRWGSSDRFLGIPVTWKDINNAHTIIESTHANLRADPSQGSHFFHNLTSLGINYLVISTQAESHIDMTWLEKQQPVYETTHIKHVKLTPPSLLKIEGEKSRCVILQPL